MLHSDNLDGTFTNPLIWADYPDPDIIRVGGDFYMASSSFTDAPGIPICHSRDLVNWKIIGHVYERLPESNPAYSMQNGTVAYRGGSWAPSLRYHNGKFHVCFCTPAEGFFMAMSKRPEGPYSLTGFGSELYDPGLFFDDDGRVFVAHGANTIRITELTPDALAIKTPGIVIYETAFGTPFEGSHLHKRDGWYYLCCTCRGYNGIQVCLRSREIYGPYEARVISADDMNYEGAGLHQGGFVDLENGETWFFMFQDRDFLGRVPVLFQVRWQDGWPMLGDPENFWRAEITQKKPVLPSAPVSLPGGGDEFDGQHLGLQWHWNHNPDNSRWSLSTRPGYLRLVSAPAQDLLHARNTLTQKIVGPESQATTLLDFSGMAEGDIAGICIQNIPCAFLGVEIRNSKPCLVMDRTGIECTVVSLQLPTRFVQLRVTATAEGEAIFSLSADGREFQIIGEPFVMEFTVKTFLGNKFGLFCFNRRGSDGGHADFDWFHLPEPKPSNLFHSGEWIPACRYDAERGVDTQRIEQKRPRQLLIRISDGNWIRFNRIDFGVGVSCLEARMRGLGTGGEISFYLLGNEGRQIARLTVPSISPLALAGEELVISTPVDRVVGIQSLEIRFTVPTGEMVRLEGIRFS